MLERNTGRIATVMKFHKPIEQKSIFHAHITISLFTIDRQLLPLVGFALAHGLGTIPKLALRNGVSSGGRAT